MTVRTLRYYDRVGLLRPREHTEAGYRLYTDEDLLRLQQILGLKYLGFSLEEIRSCLSGGPQKFAEVLAQQKAMLEAKRRQLDAILRTIADAEQMARSGRGEGDALAGVIRVMQMEQKNEWVKQHFTAEQLQKMEELQASSYSPEAREKLAARGAEWSEADQRRVQEQWARVASEARRLAAADADPAGSEFQAVAKRKTELLSAFTNNDPEVQAGLARFWEQFRALPKEQQPFDNSAYDAGEEGNRRLEEAMRIYRGRS